MGYYWLNNYVFKRGKGYNFSSYKGLLVYQLTHESGWCTAVSANIIWSSFFIVWIFGGKQLDKTIEAEICEPLFSIEPEIFVRRSRKEAGDEEGRSWCPSRWPDLAFS